MNDDQLGAFHDVIQFCLWGEIDPSPQSRADFVGAVKAGTSIASIMDGWRQNQAHTAWVDALNFSPDDRKIVRGLIANSRAALATLRGLLG
jgi:hypothetical protein